MRLNIRNGPACAKGDSGRLEANDASRWRNTVLGARNERDLVSASLAAVVRAAGRPAIEGSDRREPLASRILWDAPKARRHQKDSDTRLHSTTPTVATPRHASTPRAAHKRGRNPARYGHDAVTNERCEGQAFTCTTVKETTPTPKRQPNPVDRISPLPTPVAHTRSNTVSDLAAAGIRRHCDLEPRRTAVGRVNRIASAFDPLGGKAGRCGRGGLSAAGQAEVETCAGDRGAARGICRALGSSGDPCAGVLDSRDREGPTSRTVDVRPTPEPFPLLRDAAPIVSSAPTEGVRGDWGARAARRAP